MSQKITPKNLSYDTTLPPFLARMRGEAAGSSYGGPDPILAAQRRPARKRTSAEDEEDAPLVVDESGHAVGGVSVGRDGTVTEREAAEGAVAESEGAEKREGGDGDGAGEGDKVKDAEKMAGIGAGKKRKVGRVVGGDVDADVGPEGESDQRKSKERKGQGGDGDAGGKKAAPLKLKKKAKKIKLSFGDDEG